MLDPKRLAECEIRVSGIGRAAPIIVEPRPVEALTADTLRNGHVSFALSFDAGLCWPDRHGLTLMEAALEEGEVISLHFATLANALRCEARLRKMVQLA